MIDNSHDFFVEKERIFGKENYEYNAVRMHRAISWLYACEQHGHDDLGFLSAWIGFNACYSKPIEKIGEHEYFRISSFIGTLIKHDREDLIARYIFQEQTRYTGGAGRAVAAPPSRTADSHRCSSVRSACAL